jgi:ABC-type molybdenum transport system ATPase subunit/photorepair protein PhrA
MRPSFRYLASAPIIRLGNASFRRSNDGPSIFQNVNFQLSSSSLNQEVWAVLGSTSEERYAFLQALRGDFIASPPSSRSYPFLASIPEEHARLRSPHQAIQYVGFDAERGAPSLRGAYLSARYESRREETDFTLRDYLLNKTQLNADEYLRFHPEEEKLDEILKDLYLESLLDMPVSNLSNGQSRRAHIAKALLQGPKVLLMSNPFMGLDPNALEHLSRILENLSQSNFPRLVLALNLNEPLPKWVSHVMFLRRGHNIQTQGSKYEVANSLKETLENLRASKSKISDEDATFVEDTTRLFRTSTSGDMTAHWFVDESKRDYLQVYNKQFQYTPSATVNQGSDPNASPDGLAPNDVEKFTPGEVIVDMEGVKVQYGNRVVIGDWQQQDSANQNGLWWKIRRGERWGLFGANGSGKTTLTALMSSDHPQAYSLPIKLFNQSRLPSPGQPAISVFDLQKRIGFCSPELHAFFPKQLTVRQTLESAWADTPLSLVTLNNEIDERVNAFLRWFQGELNPEAGHDPLFTEDRTNYRSVTGHEGLSKRAAREFNESYYRPENLQWAEEKRFRELSFPAQRLLLFLRAVVKSPDLVVLDEPFSGLDAETVVKCHAWLAHGEKKILSLKAQAYSVRVKPVIRDSTLESIGVSQFKGLNKDQSLLFICHREDEVPGVVREWIRLPDPDSGGPPAFGRFDGPLQSDPNRWREVWGLPLYEAVQKHIVRTTNVHKYPDRNKIAWHLSGKFSEPDPVWQLARSELVDLSIKSQSWLISDWDDLVGNRHRGRISKDLRKPILQAAERLIAHLDEKFRKTRAILNKLLLPKITKSIDRLYLGGFDRMVVYTNRLLTTSCNQMIQSIEYMQGVNYRRLSDLTREAAFTIRYATGYKRPIKLAEDKLNDIAYYAYVTRLLMTYVQSRQSVVEGFLFNSDKQIRHLNKKVRLVEKRIYAQQRPAGRIINDARKLTERVQYRSQWTALYIKKITGSLPTVDLWPGKYGRTGVHSRVYHSPHVKRIVDEGTKRLTSTKVKIKRGNARIAQILNYIKQNEVDIEKAHEHHEIWSSDS